MFRFFRTLCPDRELRWLTTIAIVLLLLIYQCLVARDRINYPPPTNAESEFMLPEHGMGATFAL
ncbi:MAG: hypothetical protein V1838_01950 [Patescibacteria group bacterium]